MTARELIGVIDAEPAAIFSDDNLDKDYTQCFASDLMSDVLALVQQDSDKTVLITGLCNAQAIRTAEMLDMDLIVFVRGKKITDEVIELAEEAGINILCTEFSMYDTCGRLFAEGLSGIDVRSNPS